MIGVQQGSGWMDERNRKLLKELLGEVALEGRNIAALEILHETNLYEFSRQERIALAQLLLNFTDKIPDRQFKHSIIHCETGQSIANKDQPVTNVFVVAHDMPFIVDSVRMVFKKMGYKILHMLNAVQLKPEIFGIELDDNLSVLWFELDWFGKKESFSLLEDKIAGVLHDVFQSVRDWRKMQDSLREVVTSWRYKHPDSQSAADSLAESLAFIDWIIEFFTFIGSRSYVLEEQAGHAPILRLEENSGLGVLSDEPHSYIKQYVQVLPSQLEHDSDEISYFYLSKTRTASTIHRPTYTDLIVLRRFSSTGEIIGELRLIGLLTSDAYESNPLTIPFIRRKVQGILHYADLKSRFLNKSLLYIIKTFPREELFQASFNELCRMTIGALTIYDRPKVRLFVRQDVMHHFFSVILYLPRERYSTDIVKKINDYLRMKFKGTDIIHQPFFSESNLVRIYFVIQPKSMDNIEYDELEIETHIHHMAKSWSDDFLEQLNEVYDYDEAKTIFSHYAPAMGAGYRDRYSAEIAVKDIKYIENIGESNLSIAVYRPIKGHQLIGIKLFQKDIEQVELSDIFPVLSAMGLRVIQESTSEISFQNQLSLMIADLHCESPDEIINDLDDIETCIKDYLAQVFSGVTIADGLGALALRAKFSPRKIELIRTYAMYLKQINFSLETSTVHQALVNYPQITNKLFALFELRFSPTAHHKPGYDMLKAEILSMLTEVPRLDHDRTIRVYLTLIENTLRTNYYRQDTGPIAVKISTRHITDAPKPTPMLEAFIFGSEVEGVHLRQAKVARGGLRWSSRRDDYRTEILGLMKAQQVKNCIIVPAGAKGGFIAKLVHSNDNPDDVAEKGKAAYKLFINCLLDITDNMVDGEVVHPQSVVCHDKHDPYFVVAADKGTATFSDLANQIATQRGFWLGDAFASGGSNGYDHKKIAITARGAWESVRWHFMTKGTDIDHTAFSVVGIGDMSGDVFGNGMLLSENIKLIAAFNHRHIFVDPSPDPAISFKERKRLFEMPRSQWSDYENSLISQGGGVYSRSCKFITLTDEAMAALGISLRTLSPNQLIQSILSAPVDLLWNGGIGTYVKSSKEKNIEVGDFTNDDCRVNANKLRALMVAEGGNLGLTQLARVEFAKQGGLINTDFVDNSAGVDCSDHEVNLKIGLAKAVSAGVLNSEDRNDLLVEMTDSVSKLVLNHNFEQNVGLSIAQASARKHVDSYLFFIESFSASGQIDPELEYLPSRELIQSRQARSEDPFYRPELSVLIAYSKIILSDRLMNANFGSDEYLKRYLLTLFPEVCSQKYKSYFSEHPLWREMLSMSLSSRMIDMTGITFAHHLVDGGSFDVADVMRAYLCVSNIFQLDKWRQFLLDNIQVIGYKQVESELYEMGKAARKAIRWLLFNSITLFPLDAVIERFSSCRQVIPAIGKYLSDHSLNDYKKSMQLYSEMLDEDSSSILSSVSHWPQTMEIVYRASNRGIPVEQAMNIYYGIASRLSIGVIRIYLMNLVADSQWDVYERQYLDRQLDQCIGRLMVVVYIYGNEITSEHISDDKVKVWVDGNKHFVQQWLKVVRNVKSTSGLSFTIIASAVRTLCTLTDRAEDENL